MKKICYKSDGTEETGKRIIDELEKFGDVNKYHRAGTTADCYYFVNNNGYIDLYLCIPNGYTLKELPERDITTAASVIANKHMADVKYKNIKEVVVAAMIEYADLRERKSIKEAGPTFPRMMWVWNGDNKEEGHEAEVFLSDNKMKYPYVAKHKGRWDSFQHASQLYERPKPKEENVLGLVVDNNFMYICLDGDEDKSIGNINSFGECYIMSNNRFHEVWEQWAKGGFKESNEVSEFMGQKYLIKYGLLWNEEHGTVYNFKIGGPISECEDPFVQKLSNGTVKVF